MTKKEYADYLGISKQRVHQLVQQGRIVMYPEDASPSWQFVDVYPSNKRLEETQDPQNPIKRRRFSLD